MKSSRGGGNKSSNSGNPSSSTGGGGGNPSSSNRSNSSRDEFARTVARMAVAQICESVGFHSFQASAIETLADIAIRYLKDLAKAAHHYTNMGGRIESNAFDVILAMEDLGPTGSSLADRTRPVASSNAIREVMRFVEHSNELPFCKPLPRFPLSKKRPATPSFAQLQETPPGSYIPAWLPALPDAHTYRSTPVWPDHKRDAATTRLEQAKQRRKAENSLVSLHSRLAAASEEQGALMDKLEAEGRPVTGQEAFLTVLPAGSEEVSPLPPPATSSRLLIEAFAPVLKEKSAVLEVQEQQQQQGQQARQHQHQSQNPQRASVIPDSKNRPKVVFHFEFSKVLDQAAKAPAVLGATKLPVLAGAPEEEKDEKRKRVEQLLAEPVCTR